MRGSDEMGMKKVPIRVAIVGVGNCASALVQGVEYYSRRKNTGEEGLMRWDIGGYEPRDVEIVAAFDVDVRKVGKDVSEAIFEAPNCAQIFCEDVPKLGVLVRMGRSLDGVASHMDDYPSESTFVLADQAEPRAEEVAQVLKDAHADVLVNYLPVGSERASHFYADCAVNAGVGLVNCIPVFIASDPSFSSKFKEAGLPLIGDDIKSQLGATITHRALVDLFRKRGVKVERTYQINTGGNTDFLNMLNRDRLASKRLSKTEAVQSVASQRIGDADIHVGPSDYVAWQKDNKICFLRIEGSLFGGSPMNIELRLSVEDSPNSAGVVIDAIRCVKVALERGISGVLEGPSAFYMKHPQTQMSDEEAYWATQKFIKGSMDL